MNLPSAEAASSPGGAGGAGEAGSHASWRGAEAVVSIAQGMAEKRRPSKGYRHPVLDAALRAQRTRDEAAIILAARRAGVPVPVVYDIDRADATLRLEAVPGTSLRDHLARASDEEANRLLGHLGRLVARLHEAGLTHGDLTTSNVLVDGTGRLVLIDFGLGQVTEETEPRGVDVHLVEEALEATDARAHILFSSFLEGYAWRGAPAVLARLEEIRERGRYR